MSAPSPPAQTSCSPRWSWSAAQRWRSWFPLEHYEATFAAPDRVAYEQLRARATTVTTLPFDIPSEAAFYAAGRTVVDRADLLIAIWDGEPARGWGGTADVVAYAGQADTPVVVVWPRGVQRAAPPPPD